MSAELSFGADLASDTGDLRSKGGELVDHGVDGVFEFQNLTFDINGDLLGEVAICNGRRDIGDVADLIGEVARHEVDVVREIFPGSGNTLDLSLSAELSFGADLASDAGDFRSEGGELVDHGVDGVFEFQNFTFDIDGDLLGEVAICNGRCDVSDVADLIGEVARHEVDVIGEILPCSRDAFHIGLSAELSFGADLASDAGDFRSEGGELVDHGVDGVLEFENFAADVHGDLFGQVASGYRSGDFRNVPHLVRQVVGHEVDVVRKIFPGSGNALDLSLSAEFSFGADFASDTGDLRGESAQLIDHGVDDLCCP